MNAVETLFCGNDVAIVFLDPYSYIADDDEKIRQLRINKALAGTFETLDTQFQTNDEEAIVLVTLYEQRMTKNALCVGLDPRSRAAALMKDPIHDLSDVDSNENQEFQEDGALLDVDKTGSDW